MSKSELKKGIEGTFETTDSIRIRVLYRTNGRNPRILIRQIFFANVTALDVVCTCTGRTCASIAYLLRKKRGKRKKKEERSELVGQRCLYPLTLTLLQPNSDGFQSHTFKLILKQALDNTQKSGNIKPSVLLYGKISELISTLYLI